MRFHVVSFTTGVWYYQTESLAAQEGSASAKSYTQAPVTTGLKLGFTKSFGTIAFASLILFMSIACFLAWIRVFELVAILKRVVSPDRKASNYQ